MHFFIKSCFRFESLQDEINAVVKKPLYPKNVTLQVGKCVLAKSKDEDEFFRALVLDIKDDGYISCLYVDRGDVQDVNKEDIRYISNQLITKLPFQVSLI